MSDDITDEFNAEDAEAETAAALYNQSCRGNYCGEEGCRDCNPE